MFMELKGVASLALLPSGSISGHFVHTESSTCLGIYGTEIPCERECSRAEDYRLIDLRILDYKSKKETRLVVECRGEDAARFQNVEDVHGWEEDVVSAARDGNETKVEVSFTCTTLKADHLAEAHLRAFLPALVNRGAVVNVGDMIIKGLDVELNERSHLTRDGSSSPSRGIEASESYQEAGLSGKGVPIDLDVDF